MRTEDNASGRSNKELIRFRSLLDNNEMEAGFIARNPIEALAALKAFNERLHIMESAIQRKEQDKSWLYEDIPAPIITLNKNLVIEDLNIPSAVLLGKEKKHIINQPFSPMIGKPDRATFKSFIRRMISSKREQSCEIRLSVKARELIYLLLLGIPEFEKGQISAVHVALIDISKYKKAENRLLLHSEVEKADDPYIIFCSETDEMTNQETYKVEYASRAALSFLGAGAAKVIGKEVLEIFPVMNMDWLKKEIESIGDISGSRTVNELPLSALFLTPGQSEETLELKITNINRRYLLTWKNITARRKKEQALEDEKEKYRFSFENIPIGAYTTTSDGRILMANPVLISLLGYNSFEELAKRNLEEEGYENINYTREKFKSILEREGEIRGFESAWVKNNGEIIYVRENARIVKREKEIVYYEGTIEDITKEKKAESALRKSEIMTRAVLNSLSAHVAVIDASGQITTVNKAWTDFAENNQAKGNVGVGANYLDVCRKSSGNGSKKALEGILTILNGTSEEFSMEYPCHSHDEKRWFTMNVTSLPGGGATISHLNITQNVIDRESLADALDNLYKKEAMLLDVQRLAHVGSFAFNLESGQAEWSEGLFAIFERNPSLGSPSYKEALGYVHPEDRGKLEEIINDAIGNRKEFSFEHRLLLEGNKVKYVDSIGRAFYTPEGKPFRLLAAIIDISERRKYEEHLERMSQELKRSNRELEQFAFIVSHDLQEPLRMITSYIALLARLYENKMDEKTLLYVNYIVEGAERMKNLISSLLEYSRVSSRERAFEKVDLNIIAGEILQNFHFIGREEDVIIEVSELPVVLAEAVQMRQLFQNLMGNALKFRREEKLIIKVNTERLGNEWLFRVEDNGIGIEMKDAERIFEVFQRVHDRDAYPGTGIGLAICKKIVQRHGGRIWVESTPGSGSVFYFTLPA